jgi:Fuc2NAc and GlcNAc transferase
MIELIAPLSAFLLALLLTGVIRKYAQDKNIIDTPNQRSSHTIPTPRGGGLAIVISFYFFLSIFFGLGYIEVTTLYALLGVVLIALIGLIDDHGHIPARYRLLVHFCVAAWCVYWSGALTADFALSHSVLSWGIALVTVFYLVWLLNLFNFMDGIDGIAAVETITVLVGITVFIYLQADQSQMVKGLLLLFMTVITTVAGFLIWNWPPAKIFMGDVGSAFLGILLGVFSLITTNMGLMSFSIWLILLAVFITDASLTLLVRLISKEKVYQAHCSHAYQHLSKKYGHKKVTTGVVVINTLWLFPLAVLAQKNMSFSAVFMFLAYLPLVILATRSKAGVSA